MTPKRKRIFTIGLGWGIGTFVLTSAWGVWINHQHLTVIHASLMLVVWSLAGLWWGNIMWNRARRLKA